MIYHQLQTNRVCMLYVITWYYIIWSDMPWHITNSRFVASQRIWYYYTFKVHLTVETYGVYDTYIVLHWFTLFYIVLHCFTLVYIVLHYFTLFHIVLHCFTRFHIGLHWFTLVYIVFHCFTLFYIVLHCYLSLRYICSGTIQSRWYIRARFHMICHQLYTHHPYMLCVIT